MGYITAKTDPLSTLENINTLSTVLAMCHMVMESLHETAETEFDSEFFKLEWGNHKIDIDVHPGISVDDDVDDNSAYANVNGKKFQFDLSTIETTYEFVEFGAKLLHWLAWNKHYYVKD